MNTVYMEEYIDQLSTQAGDIQHCVEDISMFWYYQCYFSDWLMMKYYKLVHLP